MRIRSLKKTDSHACHAVLLRAVHEGTSGFYTRQQQNAWAPKTSFDKAQWTTRLTKGYSVGGFDWRGRLQGFFTMGHDGHVDFAYVLPHRRRSGLAGQLYAHCEEHARLSGLALLTTDASHLAKSFFEKQGWQAIAAQTVIRDGIGIENFRMEKTITPFL